MDQARFCQTVALKIEISCERTSLFLTIIGLANGFPRRFAALWMHSTCFFLTSPLPRRSIGLRCRWWTRTEIISSLSDEERPVFCFPSLSFHLNFRNRFAGWFFFRFVFLKETSPRRVTPLSLEVGESGGGGIRLIDGPRWNDDELIRNAALAAGNQTDLTDDALRDAN